MLFRDVNCDFALKTVPNLLGHDNWPDSLYICKPCHNSL